MTGWPAVFATTGLMTVALVGFNVRLWRRMRAVTAAASAQAADTHDLPTAKLDEQQAALRG